MKHILRNNIYAIKFISKYSKKFVILLLIQTLCGIYQPLSSILLLKMIGEALINGRELMYIVSLILTFTLLQGFILIYNNIMNEYYTPLTSERIKSQLTNDYMVKLKEFDLECFDNKDYYDAYTRSVSEAASRPFDVLFSLVGLMTCVFSIVTIITLMVSMHPLAIVFSIVNVLLAVFWEMKKSTIKYNMTMEKTLEERRKNYIFSLFWGTNYAKELRSSFINKLFYKKYSESSEQSLDISKKHLKRASKLNFVSSITNMLSFGLLYGYFTIMAFLGKIAVESLAPLLMAVGELGNNIGNLFNYIPQFHQHSLFIDNLRLINEYKPVIECEDGLDINTIDCIEFKNVSFTYPYASQKVISNISFMVRKGERIALVGHNGAGKTTLFKLICRFYDPQEGEILINGIDIKKYNIFKLRSLYGVVFQDYKLFSINISENILHREITSEEDERLITKAFEQCEMKERILNLPNSIYSNVSKEFDENGVVFSGGETQKLAIARAISQNSEVLLMDEPSSALDPIAEDKMINLLEDVSKNRINILITHRLANVCRMNCIYLIEEGKIVETGTHSELMATEGIYYQMFTTQSKLYQEA